MRPYDWTILRRNRVTGFADELGLREGQEDTNPSTRTKTQTPLKTVVNDNR